MKIKISNFKVEENPLNEITSEKVFKPRRILDKNNNFRFHDDGIFSNKIFGRLYKCSCGENREIGTWCSKCGDRVVSKDKMPDFYISPGVRAPFIYNDYTVFGKKATGVKKLLEHSAFLYDGKIVDFDLEELNIEEYSDNEKIKIGSEAAKLYCEDLTDEWIDRNSTTRIPVPHPIYRPIIRTATSNVLGELNSVLIELLEKRKNILSFKEVESPDGDKLQELTLNKLLYEKYVEIIDKIFDLLTKGRKSIMRQEVIAQPISGAFRAIIVNNDSLDEDTIMIGYELVSTIYPNVIKECGNDIDKMNEMIKREGYRVIVNRPPTIGEKSVIAMIPVVDSRDEAKFVISTNSIIFDGMAADTDGDAFLVISLYSREANAEAEDLLPSKNYIGGSDGLIRNKMPEDFIYAMSQIYKRSPEVRDRIKSVIRDGLKSSEDQSSSILRQI